MLRVAPKTDEWVNFVGGPFDGHSQQREKPLELLPNHVVWLVCHDAFEQLDSRIQPDHAQANHAALTSVALYRLDSSSRQPVYRFSGAISASKFGEMLRGLDGGC